MHNQFEYYDDEINETTNNLVRLSDEEIIEIYLRSKDLAKLELARASVFEEISSIDNSKQRSTPIYRRKKRLEYYFQQIGKKIEKVEKDQIKRSEQKNKARKLANESMKKAQALLAQGMMRDVMRVNNKVIAKNKLINLDNAERELKGNLEMKQADKDFNVYLNKRLAQGMDLKSAIAQAKKDLKAPQYTEPINDISEFDPSSLELEPLTKEQKQVKFEDLNLGQSRLMQEPLSTELNPIRLKKEPQKDLEEGA